MVILLLVLVLPIVSAIVMMLRKSFESTAISRAGLKF
jgi:hypothetical protein